MDAQIVQVKQSLKNLRIGLAADHGGYELKQRLVEALRAAGLKVTDFGARTLDPDDDYPDLIVPLARALARGGLDRGIAVCGSGVGACVAANKVPGVRAALITDCFSARQGVEDDDMNLLCLGGRVTAEALALELVEAFINAQFNDTGRFRRRLDKVMALEVRQ